MWYLYSLPIISCPDDIIVQVAKGLLLALFPHFFLDVAFLLRRHGVFVYLILLLFAFVTYSQGQGWRFDGVVKNKP